MSLFDKVRDLFGPSPKKQKKVRKKKKKVAPAPPPVTPDPPPAEPEAPLADSRFYGYETLASEDTLPPEESAGQSARDAIDQLAQISSVMYEEEPQEQYEEEQFYEEPMQQRMPATPVPPPPAANDPNTIHLSVASLLPIFPADTLSADSATLLSQYGGQEVPFDRAEIVSGLATGRVEMQLGDLVRRMPYELFTDYVNDYAGDLAELPLGELVRQVPPDWFDLGMAQDTSKEMLIEDMEDLFKNAPGELEQAEPLDVYEAEDEVAYEESSTGFRPPADTFDDIAADQDTMIHDHGVGAGTEHARGGFSVPETPTVEEEPELAMPGWGDGPASIDEEPEDIASPSLQPPTASLRPLGFDRDMPTVQEEEPELEPPVEGLRPPSLGRDAATIDEEQPAIPDLPPFDPAAMPTLEDETVAGGLHPPAGLEPPVAGLQPPSGLMPPAALVDDEEDSRGEIDGLAPPVMATPAEEEAEDVFEEEDVYEPEAEEEVDSEAEAEGADLAPPAELERPSPDDAPAPVAEIADEEDEEEEPELAALAPKQTASIALPEDAKAPDRPPELIRLGPTDPAKLDLTVFWESRAPYGVNVNTATKSELAALPGVGEELAQAILDHRDVRGTFHRLQELLMIPGLSQDIYRVMTCMDPQRDLSATEVAVNEAFGIETRDIQVVELARTARSLIGLAGVVLADGNGEVIAADVSEEFEELTEGLCAAGPQLHRRAAIAMKQIRLPATDMFTFYLDAHAITFAGQADIFMICLHGGSVPTQEQLTDCRRLANELAWYCAERAVV